MAELTGMLRQTVTIPAQTVKTIDYRDKNPNYFHIQNNGVGTIYFSAHGMPTTSKYDMKLDGGIISTFADPYTQPEIHIYNPSMEDIPVIIMSFQAPFDPSVLAQANKQIAISGTVTTDGIIKAFETSLPNGNNKIGKVDVTTLPSIPKGSNNIGKVDVTSMPTVNVENVENLVEKTDITNTKLDMAIELLQGLQDPEQATNTVQGFIERYSNEAEEDIVVKPPEGRYFSKLIAINNQRGLQTNILFTSATDDEISPNYGYLVSDIEGYLPINMNMKCSEIVLRPDNSVGIEMDILAETKPYNIKTVTLTEFESNMEAYTYKIPDGCRLHSLEIKFTDTPHDVGIYGNNKNGESILYSDYFTGNEWDNSAWTQGPYSEVKELCIWDSSTDSGEALYFNIEYIKVGLMYV